LRLHLLEQPLADADGHVLVEAAMVAERPRNSFRLLLSTIVSPGA
jgi:hypothetical protein